MPAGSHPDVDPLAAATAVDRGISGFVLAGGRSSRLGQDKTLLPWPPRAKREETGPTLLDHAIAQLRHVCDPVSICADRKDLRRPETVIPDALPERGPLGAIVAALEQSSTDWNLFLAVDLPLLPGAVLEALVARVRATEKTAAADGSSAQQRLVCLLPQVEDLPQPLCGLYHRCLAPGLRRALEEGKLKLIAALREAAENSAMERRPEISLSEFRIELWDAAEFAATWTPPSAVPAREWFLNVNTPEDWERARTGSFA